MNALRLSLCCALPVLLVSSLAPAQAPAYSPGPVPPAILHAQKLFIANGGADSGLFPEPFSGNPNRPYDQFFAAMQATGEYQLASDPARADLVLEIRLIAPYGPSNPSKQRGASDPLPMFRLKIYDVQSRFCLWTITESVEFAILQRTHDRNFDDALSRVVADFQALRHTTAVPAGAQPAPPTR